MNNKLNQLIEYIELIDEWNKKINLISYHNIDELIIDHIIDSLSILECIDFNKNIIADIGTGPGLPGIVLSILKPNNKYYLIEPNKKYYRFLKKAVSTLKLENITIINKKIENAGEINKYNVLMSRAVGSISLLLNKKNVDNADIIIFYKGIKVFDELKEINTDKYKILFLKKIKILETYNKNHYIIALIKR